MSNVTIGLLFTRVWIILFIPLMPLVILIDIMIGDKITGVVKTKEEKIIEHVQQWFDYWHDRDLNHKTKGGLDN